VPWFDWIAELAAIGLTAACARFGKIEAAKQIAVKKMLANKNNLFIYSPSKYNIIETSLV
jgi:hypothetical protein